jgi:hypothetical protein
MSECEEVAQTMLQPYLAWKRALPCNHPHSLRSVSNYVMCQLSKTETHTVINNITHALHRLVLAQ